MKYITMQQKLSIFFVLSILTGCVMNAAVRVRGPIDHTNSIEWLKDHFDCDTDYANEIKSHLMGLDSALFDFLDFKGNTKKYADHVRALQGHINKFKKMIDTEKQNKKHKKAVKKLTAMRKILDKICTCIKDASATTGMVAAMNLGTKIKPLLEEFDNCLPISMNVEEMLKRKYNVTEIAYLGHLRARLDNK